MSFLRINNLSTQVDGKDILKKINLKIEKGETHVLLGANASGKSTLLYTLMGFPKYNVVEGNIVFNGKNITGLEIEERARMGIAAVYQNPPAINVKLSKLLDKISKRKIELEGTKELMEREVNIGFSGGERKLSEVIQVISLNPEFIILDELDAGLDIKNLERLSSIIKKELDGKSILLITHRGRALRFFKPDFAHVMLKGEIVCSSKNWQKIWKTIEEDGYERCKRCELYSNR
ncbi:ABC transporter ATP-binding protein [Maledivibacter halophilus]|uniref:Fe-S cluster assembly ATP-binding protein n=1 Tax=Maledivibacter halophilus TaxID=36842 RepID=A0A1T5LYJ1_9FIRM|nr:ABC transporter ATP-binding protein [Maledivibacter halophilus]SKC81051.1 Fe-S cluster assembly ATP-binding protein [Maledivibacter halophilus]